MDFVEAITPQNGRLDHEAAIARTARAQDHTLKALDLAFVLLSTIDLPVADHATKLLSLTIGLVVSLDPQSLARKPQGQIEQPQIDQRGCSTTVTSSEPVPYLVDVSILDELPDLVGCEVETAASIEKPAATAPAALQFPRRPQADRDALFPSQDKLRRPRSAEHDGDYWRHGIMLMGAEKEYQHRVIIRRIPKGTTSAQVLAKVRGGAVVSCELLDTSPLEGTFKGCLSALVRFRDGGAALAYTEFAAANPIVVNAQRVMVDLIPTSSYPLSDRQKQAIFIRNGTRCLEIRPFAADDDLQAVRRDLGMMRGLSFDGIERMRYRDGALEVRFTSVFYCEQVYEALGRNRKYENCRWKTIQDPCVGLLEKLLLGPCHKDECKSFFGDSVHLAGHMQSPILPEDCDTLSVPQSSAAGGLPATGAMTSEEVAPLATVTVTNEVQVVSHVQEAMSASRWMPMVLSKSLKVPGAVKVVNEDELRFGDELGY